VALLERLARLLAALGGVLMLGVSVLCTVSVGLRWLTSNPIAGDVEIVSIGAGLAAFLCLPYAQARGSNIMVDSLTSWAPAWVNRGLDALWALVYAGICGVLAWRLSLGAAETIRSHTTSQVLAIPYGWAIYPAAGAFALTGLLALAAIRRPVRA
jgi:TRAP-type C4-dicarboxylate transport system permease small subunit